MHYKAVKCIYGIALLESNRTVCGRRCVMAVTAFMVWAVASWAERLELHRVNGSLNAQWYINDILVLQVYCVSNYT